MGKILIKYFVYKKNICHRYQIKVSHIFLKINNIWNESSISLLTKSLKICYNSGEILFIYQIRGVS